MILSYFFHTEFDSSFQYVERKTIIPEEKEVIFLKSTPLGYLTIPKLELHLPWYSLNDEENTVSKNIEFIKSNLPDVKNGNFILAAHSGNSKVSYFSRIHLLEIGDIIFVTYQGKTYNYEIIYYYEILKSEFDMIRPTNETTLTLITCVTMTNRRYVVVAKQI